MTTTNDLSEIVSALPQDTEYTCDERSFTLENDAVNIFCFYGVAGAHLFIRFLQSTPKCTLASRAPIHLDNPNDKLRCAYIEMETGERLKDHFVFIPSKNDAKTGFPANEPGDEHSDGFFFAHKDLFKEVSLLMEQIAERYRLREYHKV